MQNNETAQAFKTVSEEFDIRDTHCKETYYHCPNCDKSFGNKENLLKQYSEMKFCFNCGLKLDWSGIK
jgi:hypothetical protein